MPSPVNAGNNFKFTAEAFKDPMSELKACGALKVVDVPMVEVKR